jgi:hypothetical protein
MKKILVGLVAAATTVAVAAPPVTATITDLFIQSAMNDLVAWDAGFAEIAPTVAPASNHQFVAGSHKVVVTTDAGTFFQHVRVSAHSGPAGADPHGSVRVTFDFGFDAADVKGDVTCLDVEGNTARLAARLREPRSTGETHVTLFIVDFGNPGPTGSPDLAFIGFTSTPPPIVCHAEGTQLGGEATGNLVVKDDTP